jgi:hypothetical protein
VCGAEVGEALEDMERYMPFSRCRVAWCAERVCGSDVGDDGLAVGECDVVSCGDDVVDTDEGCTETIGDYGGWVGSDVCGLFHWLCFHVAVTDRCTWRRGTDVVLPDGAHEETAWGSCHHSATVDDCVRVVWREVDVFDDCLGAVLGGLLRVGERGGGVGVGGLVGVVGLWDVRVGWAVGRGLVAVSREVVLVADVVSPAIASVEGIVEPVGVVAVCFAEGVMLT